MVRSVFENHGLPSTESRAFNPHLTVAKVSKARRKRKGIKHIEEETYSSFLNASFGSEVVSAIELLSMTEPTSEDGYYHCFERCSFFETSGTCDRATISWMPCMYTNAIFMRHNVIHSTNFKPFCTRHSVLLTSHEVPVCITYYSNKNVWVRASSWSVL